MVSGEAETFLGEEDKTQGRCGGCRCMQFFTLFLDETEFRGRLLHTFCLSWSFASLGWIGVLAGVSLPDLGEIVQRDLEATSWLLTVGAFGMLLGSLAGGSLFDRYKGKVKVIGVSCLGMAVSLVVLPFCSLFPLMLAVKFVNAAFVGGLNTAGNAYLPYIWGSDCSSYMQMMHFGVSLGSILAAIVSEPFLSKPRDLSPDHLHTNFSSTGYRVVLNGTRSTTRSFGPDKAVAMNVSRVFNSARNLTESFHSDDGNQITNVHFAYLIPGILVMVGAASFLVLHIGHIRAVPLSNQLKDKDKDHQMVALKSIEHRVHTEAMGMSRERSREGGMANRSPENTIDRNPSDVDGVSGVAAQDRTSDVFVTRRKSSTDHSLKGLPVLKLKWKIIFVVLVSMLNTIMTAVESGHSQFFLTFCISYIQWTKTKASFLTSVVWVGFAFGRFIAIFFVGSFRSRNVLFLYLALLTLSLSGFTLAVLYDVTPLLWLFNITAGISMSVLVPSLYTWATTEVFQITGKIFAVFMIATNVGGMVFPLLFGNMMERFSQLWFNYLLIILSGSGFLLFVSTAYLIHRQKR